MRSRTEPMWKSVLGGLLMLACCAEVWIVLTIVDALVNR
jgi:hypothetical protein